jgi:hypothetical protein
MRVVSPETHQDQIIDVEEALLAEDIGNDHRRNTTNIAQSRNSSSAHPQMNSRTAASVLSKKSRNENWPTLACNTVGEP